MGRRFAIGIVLGLAVIGLALVAGGATTGNPEPQTALTAPGDTPDYGRGSAAPPLAVPPPWYEGLKARSEALNRMYGLGEYAPDWLKALTVRSEALNRMYGLGEYATPAR